MLKYHGRFVRSACLNPFLRDEVRTSCTGPATSALFSVDQRRPIMLLTSWLSSFQSFFSGDRNQAGKKKRRTREMKVETEQLEDRSLLTPPLGALDIYDTSSLAPNTDVDPIFDTDGWTTTSFSTGNDVANVSIAQADGKIVVVGTAYNGTDFDIALSRYNTDGSLDTSFGTGGKVTTAFGGDDDEGVAVAMNAAGSIYVGGTQKQGADKRVAIVKYTSTGALDTSFDTDGKLTFSINNRDEIVRGLVMQPDGKILVAGESTSLTDGTGFFVARVNTNGSMDSTFNSSGKQYTNFPGGGIDVARSIALQPDGKIVLGGYASTSAASTNFDFAIARYTSTGALDTTFDTDGMATYAIGSGNEEIFGLRLQPDGKIVAAGYSFNATSKDDFAVIRVTTTGVLDTTFSGDGIVTTDVSGANLNDRGHGLRITTSDKIVIGGYAIPTGTDRDFAMVQYNSDGTLDTAYNTTGIAIHDLAVGADDQINALSLQANGHVIATGSSPGASGTDFTVARFIDESPTGKTQTTLSGGNLTIDDIDTTIDNVWTINLSVDGLNLVFNDAAQAIVTIGGGSLSNSNHTFTIPVSSITGTLTINASGGNDSLTIDFRNGSPIPSAGFTFNGGNPTSGPPGDSLILTRGTSTGLFQSIAHSLSNESDGSISLDTDGAGAAAPSIITYTGLEPVSDNLDTVDRVFNFNFGAETISLQDITDSSGNHMQIDSNVGSETIQFANPSGTLTINAGAGDDIVNIASVDSAFRAGLTINGGTESDTINLSAALTLGSASTNGNVAFTAEAINLSANVNTDAGTNAGSVTLTGPVVLGANVAIDTDGAGTDGAVSFLSSVNADAAGNSRTLGVAAGGAALSISGNAGTTQALQSLTVTSANTVALQQVSARSGGISITASGAITLAGNLASDAQSTAGPISISGAVTLTGPITLDSDSTTDAAITFASGSTLNGGQVLTLNSGSGNTVLNSTVIGGVTPLTSLLVTAGDITGSGGIATVNGVTVTNTGSVSNLSGVISGASAIFTKSGVGSLTLSGTSANTYGGVTTINNGVLILQKSDGVNAIAGSISIGDGVSSDILRLGASNQIANTSVLTFLSGASGNSAKFELNGYLETVAGITSNSGQASLIQSVEDGLAEGPNNPSILTVNNTADFVFDGLIRNNNSGLTRVGLVKSGAGTLTHRSGFATSASNFSGTTTINSGKLIFDDLSLLNSTITNNSAAADALTFNQSAQSLTLSTVIGGSGAVTKLGANVLTLSGTSINTYTGATTVSAGTLLLSSGSELATGSAVSIGGTGVLAGTGTVKGSVSVNSGGKIVPGTDGTVGTLTVEGNLAFNGGTYRADIHDNASDTLLTSGTIDLAATTQGVFEFGTISGTTAASQVFTLINNSPSGTVITDSPFSGAAENGTTTVNGKTAAYSYQGGLNGNDFTLSVTGPYSFSIPVNGAANTAVLKQNGMNLDFIVDGVTLQSVPIASLGTITITGEANQNDTLTLDYSGGDFGAGKTINFDGGVGGNDTLVTIGGTFTVMRSTYTNSTDGTVELQNGLGTRTINYTGLEPIVIGGTLTDVVINLPVAASNAILEDDGILSNGMLRIRSGNGTFETTTFPSPSNSLVVTRGNVADTLNITVPATDFNANLTIGTLVAPLSSVTFTAAQNISAGGGNVSVRATTVTVTGLLTASGAFSTSAATINLNNNIDATTLTGIAAAVNVNNTTVRIQDGITLAANGGSTITLAAGTYNQSPVISVSETLSMGGSVTLDSFSGTSTNFLDLGGVGNTLTLKDLDPMGFSGKITGAGSLTLDRPNKEFILAGNSDYSGTTTLVQPNSTLIVDNSSGSATGTGLVSIFGTLMGGSGLSGKIHGNVTIQSGAHLRGEYPLQIGATVPPVPVDVIFMGGSHMDVLVDDPLGNSTIVVSGDVIVNVGATMNFISLTGSPPSTTPFSNTYLVIFDIRNGVGPISGTFTINDGNDRGPGTDPREIDDFLGRVDLDVLYTNQFDLVTMSQTGGNDVVVSFLPTTFVTLDAGNLVVADIRGKNSNDTLTITYVTDENSVTPVPYFMIYDPYLLLGTDIIGATPPTLGIPDIQTYVKVPAHLVTGNVLAGRKVIVRTEDTDLGYDDITVNVMADDQGAPSTASFPFGIDIDSGVNTPVGGNDTVTFASDVNTTDPTALHPNPIIAVVNAPTIYVAANLRTDGGSISLDPGVGGLIRLAITSVTIDSEQGGDSAGGNITLGGLAGANGTISANLAGTDLVISSSAGGVFNAGNLVVPGFGNAAGFFLNDLTLSATGAAAANYKPISINYPLGLSTYSAEVGDLSIDGDVITIAIAALVNTTGTIYISGQNSVAVNEAVNAAASTITILANQDGAGAQGFSQGAGGNISTTNETTSALSVTVGGTGGAAIRELTTGTASGRVTISAGGSITDNDTILLNNILAYSASLLAGGAIGAAGDLIETTLAELAAQSGVAGGVFVSNTGALNITTVGALSGIVTNGGDAILTGSSVITINQAITAGAGDVRLTSGGAVTQGAAGSITADGLELLGTGPYTLTNTGNDVVTLAGNVTNAVTYLDRSDLTIGTVTTVGLSTTDSAISIQTNNALPGSTGLTVSNLINAGNAPVTLTVNLAGATRPITNNAAITGNAVTLTADKMLLAGGTITATSSGRVILQPTSSPLGVDLGSAVDTSGTQLELSDAEIDTITTTGVLEIRSTTTGVINVSAAITPAGVNIVRLVSGSGGVTEGGAGSLQVANLAVTATGGNINLNNAANNVTNFAASGNAITLNEVDGFDVTNVDGVDGASGTTVSLTSGGTITVQNTLAANDINATSGIDINVTGDDAFLVLVAGSDIKSAAGGVTASADKMNLLGTITAAGQTVTLQTGANGTSTDAINLGSGTDAVADTLELSDTELGQITALKLVIGSSSASAITVSSDITLNDGPVIPTLRLNTGSTVTGTAGGIVVSDLAIDADGAVNFTDATTNVTNLAIKTTTGNILFTEANGLTVAAVDGILGVDTDSGNVTLNVTLGNLTVNDTGAPQNDIDATTGILLTLSGNDAVFTVNAGADVETVGNNLTNDIIINADEMVLTGTVTASGSNQIVTLRNNTVGKQIILGTNPGTAGILELSDAELDNVSAGNVLRIGRSDAAATADITFTNAITAPGGWSTLHLITESAVVDSNATNPDITVANLAINSQTGIAATGTNSVNGLEVLVTNLAFNNGTSGSVEFTEAVGGGGIVINSVDGVTTSSNSGTTTQITANGPVTFAVNTTSNGTLTANAIETATTNFDNITVNAGVTVVSNTGDVVFSAGDRITVNNTATVRSDVGNIVLTSGFGDIDNDGSQVLDGTIQGDDSATTRVTIDLQAEAGSATQAATGSILAGALRLLSTTNGGSFSLGTSATNDVDTIAANTDGSISYRDLDNLIVGTATTVGITTSGDDVQLTTASTILIDDDIVLGLGDLGLDAGAAVTQNAGDNITATGLALTATGPFTLTNTGNNVTRIAGNSANIIHFVDANTLSVGAINVLGNTTTGITTSNDDVTLQTELGNITIDNTINLGAPATGGDLELILNDGTSAAVSQAPGANILGHGLALLSGGNGSYQYTLDNIGNNVANIAADFYTGAVAFALRYQDADDLHVNSVTGLTDTTTGISTGVPANGGGVRLRAGQTDPNGQLFVDNDIDTRNGTGGNLTISGGVQFTTGSTFNGQGDIDLGGGAAYPDILVNVPTTHTMTGGTVTYRPDRDIIISSSLSVINGSLSLDADGEGPVIAQTIAQTSANLSTGNNDGGLWIRANGSVNVQPGVNGGGALVMAGSDIHNDPIGGAFAPGPVAEAGVQVDDTTAVTEVIGDSSIAILTKTVGTGEDDMQLDGIISSDNTGPINVQVEDTLSQTGTVQLTTAGTITYDAQDMIIDPATAVINAQPTGIVWLRNRAAGRAIDVGTNTAGQLGLTDAELDRIEQASVIRIGRRDGQASGDLTVTAGPITPLNNDTLHLISGSNLLDTPTGFIVITNLALEASNNIQLDTGTDDLTANDHDVAVLAMATYNANSDATYVSRTNFTIGTVDGVVGINVQDVTAIRSGIESTLSGEVIQTSAIISDDLQLLGQGNFTLDLASNNVNTIAGIVENSIIYTDVDDVTVGTVTSVLQTTNGTTSSSITLTAPTVIVNRPIVTTNELGFVILDVTTLLDINGTIGGGALVDPIIDSMGFVQQTGTGAVQFQGQIITTEDNVSFNGPVTIGTTAGSSALIDTGSGGGGSILFNSTVRGTTPSATPTFENLTLIAGTGDILFNGQVGGGGFRLGEVEIQSARHVTTNVGFTAREILQLTGTGETRFNGFVQTNQPNGIDITSNYITFNGSIQTTNNGIVRINNASDFQLVPGTGAISSDGAVTQTGVGLNLIGGDIATTDDVISFAADTYISNTSVLMNAGLGDVSFARLLQVNNKTLTIRDGNSVDLGTRTTIANGTLNVFVGNAPSVVPGTLDMSSGALFTGAGTVNATLNVPSGGTLAPASATTLLNTGILTFNGDVNLASGSVFAIELNAAAVGTGYDQLAITGAGHELNITAGAVMQASRFGSFSPTVGTVLRVVDGAANVVNGAFTGATNGSTMFLNGAYFTINYNSPNGDITLTSANAPGGAAKIIDNDEGASSQYLATNNNGTLVYSPSNAWTLNTVAGRGFTNDLRFANGVSGGTATATYTFNGLTPGTTYQISTTWFPLSNRATNAPFTISGGAAPQTVVVNQRNAPVGYNSNGATWQDLLGSYTVTGTSLTIQLSNNANGYVIADAVRIHAISSAGPEVQVVNTTDGDLHLTNNSGSVNFGTTIQGGANISKVITITNTGSTQLILGSATLNAPAGFSIVGYTPTSLAPGASLPVTIELLSTTAGNYSGSISFQTNDVDENPFTFNLVGSVVSTSVWIVDNDPNTGSDLVIGQAPVTGSYTETGTWVSNTDPNVGYLQDLRFANENASSTGIWTFSGLTAGTYRVSVTYRAEPNRASNASFTVTDGVTPVTVSVNQRNQPGSFQSATVYWQDLIAAYGSVTSGTITVTLDAAGSNGYVIADAVRIERIGPLEATGGPAPTPTSSMLTQAELDSVADTAIARWQSRGLNALQLAALQRMEFRITDLPGALLSGTTEATIFIDPTAAGYGWYVDHSPTIDSEFDVLVASTERRSTNPAVATRMDLLTVLMHELGHRLGSEHAEDGHDHAHDLMADEIGVGVRRLPEGIWPALPAPATTTPPATTPPTGTTTPTTPTPTTPAPTKPLTAAEIKLAEAAAKAAAAKAAAEKAAAAKAAAAKAAAEKAAAAKAAAAKLAAEKAAAAKAAAAKAAAEKAAAAAKKAAAKKKK